VTTTYDPHDPSYLVEADVREELTRVFDLCQGCRRCVQLCSSFPTLFDLVDANEDHAASNLTEEQQDQVVDECFQCKRCYLNCPYVPGRSDWNIDFPRLLLRASAVRAEEGEVPGGRRRTNALLGRTDLVGRTATRMAPLANAVLGTPRSLTRRAVQAVTGVSSARVLPPYARQRFTTWFKNRPKVRIQRRQGKVAVFPTCIVEYHVPAIGQDLIKVYERNGVECTVVTKARCCGAPWLHAGELEHFTKQATANVKELAAAVRDGNDIVVAQATCGYVLKRDYVDYVSGPDARLVAEHTFDAAEYLMRLDQAEATSLDTTFRGDVPETIVYHAPCHLRAQGIGLKSRDLLKLTGARIRLVQECSGIDGMWGLRAENVALALPHAVKLGAAVERASAEVVAGDCNLANSAIIEQTGRVPLHPLQVMARAYGIAEETT
jgi:Fe-S oxidoreductase